MGNSNIRLSVVIPVYFSGKRIAKLVDEVYRLYSHYQLEVVLVNDGSTDDTDIYCEKSARSYPGVIYIELRKNYGEHNAVLCGLNYCSGDYAVIIDDDFQNPPQEIARLLAVSDKHDVVYSKYIKKRHHFFRNLGSKLNDIFSTYLLDKPKGLYLSSFKLINREIINEIIKYRGPFPYIDGLILRCTSSIGSVEVEHSNRNDGESNYTFSKLLHLWLSMFVNFSIKPMRFIAFTGFIASALSLLFAILVIVEKSTKPDIAIGWASTIIVIVLLFGLQFIFLGIIGEYLGKQYLDQNGTPQWTVKKVRQSDN